MRELKDVVLVGKHVGLRVDLNVPIEDGAVMNDERLSATLPTILEILKSTKNLTNKSRDQIYITYCESKNKNTRKIYFKEINII